MNMRQGGWTEQGQPQGQPTPATQRPMQQRPGQPQQGQRLPQWNGPRQEGWPQGQQQAPGGYEPEAPARRAVSELIGHLDQQPAVPVTGWRKVFGLGPSKAALEQADDEKWLRASFPRPLTIVVATPKGGAGKTPTTVGLASAFGLARGGGVVAWDNNELRGTLADRTFSAHRNTVVDLLARQEDLLRKDARVADIQAMLNYQANGQFWVLGSSQQAGQQITEENFQTVREILARFFPVVVIDTGNNEVAANWLEAVHNADVVLLPVKWRKDNILSAARMLETLTEQGRDVVSRCVVVGTNGPGELMPSVQAAVADWFRPLPIVEVPTDAHIAEGAEIDWQRLQPATQRAYQRLGATVAMVASKYLSS